MKWLIYAAITVFSISATVSADEKNSGLITLSQPEFHDQVVSQGCGYWDERQVRVCDYRTVLVTEPYTACHYNRTYASNPALFPTTVTTTHGPQHSCQYTITHGAPGMSPHATYHLRSSEQLTRQVERTEEYNCRMESRMVWVELPNCNGNPQIQSQQLSSGVLTWQYAPNFKIAVCPAGAIPAQCTNANVCPPQYSSVGVQTPGSACSAPNRMARTDEATAGPDCYRALKCH